MIQPPSQARVLHFYKVGSYPLNWAVKVAGQRPTDSLGDKWVTRTVLERLSDPAVWLR